MLSCVSSGVGIMRQLDAAVAPRAHRFDPGARALLVVRLEILVVEEVAVALLQAEAARRRLRERARDDAARVGERAPDPFAGRRGDRQAVGVVHLGPVVLELRRAGSRRSGTCWSAARCPGACRLLRARPQEQPRLHLDHRVGARRDPEAIGAGHAPRIEQRVELDRLRIGRRLARARTPRSAGTPRPPAARCRSRGRAPTGRSAGSCRARGSSSRPGTPAPRPCTAAC